MKSFFIYVGALLSASTAFALPAKYDSSVTKKISSFRAHKVYDLIVYGGTSAGVTAAVQGKRMGKDVLLLSPEAHLGGMTSNGLGWVDAGDVRTIGGLSLEFFHQVWVHYQADSAWKWERKSGYPGRAQSGSAWDPANKTMWVFEPHFAERIFDDWIAENRVPVAHGALDLRRGVLKRGTRIVGLQTTDGKMYSALAFIDASYEGDLLRGARISYVIGRESNSAYGETLDGLQVGRATKNQLPSGISAYRVAGRPGGGLLPGVEPAETQADGEGDKRIQAYCYRMCLTDRPENRVPIEKPVAYRESDYEILFRAIAAGQVKGFFTLDRVPNRKTDSNNSGGISTDLIGQNYAYPETGYEERSRIAAAHENWQLGLLWTLQNSPRVPEEIRKAYAPWGLCRDEFADHHHWPYELYIRESIRMVGEFEITERTLREKPEGVRSVGMGSYAMDSHNVRRLARADGTLMNEGDVEESTHGPYAIDYRAMTPRESECSNLLVPVCLSATHIAYGSIRMEPVFMILGQSAGTAAVLALQAYQPVQSLDYRKLAGRLKEDGQVLSLTAGPRG